MAGSKEEDYDLISISNGKVSVTLTFRHHCSVMSNKAGLRNIDGPMR